MQDDTYSSKRGTRQSSKTGVPSRSGLRPQKNRTDPKSVRCKEGSKVGRWRNKYIEYHDEAGSEDDDLSYPVDARGYTGTPGASSYLRVSESKLQKDRHFGVGAAFVRWGRSVRYSYAALDREAAKNRSGLTERSHELDETSRRRATEPPRRPLKQSKRSGSPTKNGSRSGKPNLRDDVTRPISSDGDKPERSPEGDFAQALRDGAE